MAARKYKVGAGECPACKREVVWRKTEGGALSMFCQHCDLQAYAKDGTEAERIIMGSIGADPAPAAAPKPAPLNAADSNKQAPQPAPKKSSPFGLGAF